MKTIGRIIGIVAILGVAACMGGPEDEDDSDVPVSGLPGGETFQLCRYMAGRLAGTEATLWQIKNQTDIIAVAVGPQPLCVDTPPRVYQLGLIQVEPKANENPFGGPKEEATPMPGRTASSARLETSRW